VGQGSAALELVEDVPDLDQFYCPISGGGLIAGCATAVAACSPRTEIIGVEPAVANDTFLSLEAGQRVKIDPPKTIADGLRCRTPGDVTWPIIQRLVRRVVLVSEDEMRQAIAWAAYRARLVLEPSGAAALAVALREGRGRCGVLLSGGNVDPTLFAEIMQSAIPTAIGLA
jgi:threonine dehydratase